MDRRSFLRSLLGASAVVAAPAPIKYFFAPRGGWTLKHRVYSFKDVNGFITQPLQSGDWQIPLSRIIGTHVAPSRIFELHSMAELTRVFGQTSSEYAAAEAYFSQGCLHV